MRKRFLLLVACATAFGATAQAQNLQNIKAALSAKIAPKVEQLPTKSAAEIAVTSVDNFKGNSTQAVNFTSMFQADNATFTYLQPNLTPLVYDAKSNVLALVRNERKDGSGTIGVNLQVVYSTNGGRSWASTPKSIFVGTNDYLGMPQVGIGNPNNSTKLADLNFLTIAASYPGAKGHNRDGQAIYYAEGSNSGNPLPYDGPATNNPSGYKWGNASGLTTFSSPSFNGFIMGGVLSPPDENTQYGPYGVLTINSNLQDESDIVTTMPSAWANSQFRQSPSKTSSYNGPMYTDADSKGVLYAAINGIFADDQDNRVVAVSKSTDKGTTWTEFTRMPANLLSSYATANQVDNAIAFSPYQQDAFVVTGEDQFSYVYRVALIQGTGQDASIKAAHIVEVNYDKGTWDMRKVAEFNDVPSHYFINFDTLEQSYNNSKLVTFQNASSMGNEVQVARAADGSGLVVKWVDYNTSLGPIVLNPAQTILIQDQQTGETSEHTLDTTYATDVYFAIRKSNETSWSAAVNLTNDKNFDKGTHIPNVLPVLDSVPLVIMRGVSNTSWSSSTTPVGKLLKAAPNEYLAMIVNLPNNVLAARPRVAAISDVTPAEDNNTNFALNAPVPNPSAGETDLSFNSNVSGRAHLAIYNALGEEVLTVMNNVMVQPGTQGKVVNTSSLVSGTYYVSLNVNGTIQTRPLVVIH